MHNNEFSDGGLNFQEIQRKTEAFARSPEGKRQMREIARKCEEVSRKLKEEARIPWQLLHKRITI
jgi:hypothetical protein